MRAVVQRVGRASVRVEGEVVAVIGCGLAVLLGVGPEDDEGTARRLASRVATLRVFGDADGRMNLDAASVGGEVLVVSQFTLYGDASRGHRPSFVAAGPASLARALCDVFARTIHERGLVTRSGVFGAHMELDLGNDGPVTLVLSSGEDAWTADAG